MPPPNTSVKIDVSHLPQSEGFRWLYIPQLQAPLQSEASFLIRQPGWERTRLGGSGPPCEGRISHHGSCLWTQPEQCFWEVEVQESYSSVTDDVHKLVYPVPGTQWTPRLAKSLFASELQWNLDERDIQETASQDSLSLTSGTGS